MRNAKCNVQNGKHLITRLRRELPPGGSLSINNPLKTNFVERLAVVGPKRLREQLFRQRTEKEIQWSLYCINAFTKTQSTLDGKKMNVPSIEGAFKKAVKVLKGWG